MVLRAAKKIAFRGIRRFGLDRSSQDLTPHEVQAARQYISDYWSKLQRYNPKDQGSLVGVPHPYLVPSYAEGHEFDYSELYYWDSYFMIQGFLKDPARKQLVMGILDDLVALFERFHIIPNGSQLYYVSRSHPPLLTSFIFDIYNAYQPGNDWLKTKIAVAQEEYKTVWMGTRKPNARQIYQGLSRYYDFNYLHDLTEAESGWDYTPRFNRRALNFLPVDLNALLYKYESDFARAARLLGNEAEAATWDQAAQRRQQTMDQLMWDKLRGLYYDYNYVKEKRGTISSVATYFPLWAGLANADKARQIVKNGRRRFEQKGGLATTDNLPLSQYRPGAMPTQWAYPNGWAPLMFIAVQGMRRYGYHEEAKRIATKWLRCNLAWFTAHHEFLEKYNVVSPGDPPAKGVYPSQTGFGWTNAVFERFCQEFVDPQTGAQ